MELQASHFQRNLLIVLILLFIITLAGLSYPSVVLDPGITAWWLKMLNVLILSIPLVLLFGSIYVLVMGWYERSTLGQVGPCLSRIIHWTPRIAAILIILFTSLFSLDVFGERGTPLQVLGGFLMHNIPSIVMLVVLILAWKRPVVGFAAFLLVAVAFCIFFVRDIYALSNLLLFILPLLLIASLFYADWQWVKQ